MDTARLRPRWGDAAAVLLVVLLALLLLFAFLPRGEGGGATAVELRRDGVLLRTLSLQVDGVYQVDGPYPLEVTISGGRVAVTASQCPNGDCRRMGWRSAAGDLIVCLPGRVELRLVGEGGFDAVAG